MSGTDELLATIARQWQDAVDDRRPDPLNLLRELDGPPQRRQLPLPLLIGAVAVFVVAAAVVPFQHRHTTHALGQGHPTPGATSTSNTATNDLGHVSRSSRVISVAASGPCPRVLGDAGDVAPPSIKTGPHLVPQSLIPQAGLVCNYHAVSKLTATSAPAMASVIALLRSTTLTSAEAADLARAISHVSLNVATGVFHCPEDRFGAVTVIAFDYHGRTVDLWQDASGCQTLDNGDLLASENANPSFFSDYVKPLDAIAKH